MPKTSKNFTPAAAEALALAQAEALRFRQPDVAPEHVLLGLLRQGNGRAVELLRAQGVDAEALRAAVESRLSTGTSDSPPGGTTAPADAVMAGAVRTARELRHSWIGQEHILCALAESPGAARDVLEAAGVTLAGIRAGLRPAGTPGETYSRAQIAAHVAETGPAFEGVVAPAGIKRYNLGLPYQLFDQVEAIATREGTTVLEVLRRAVKLALLVDQSQRDGASLVIRQDGREREVVLL